MFKLIYKSPKGESIELFGPPFRLIKVEGLGDVGADIQTQRAPYQDGSTFIDTRLNERPISIELKIVGKNEREIEQYRSFLGAIFNPRLGLGTLHYIGANGEKQIQAVSENIPFFPDGSNNRSRTHQKALVNLLCPDPYWKSEENVDQLVVWEGGLTFPLSLPTTFASLSTSKSKILVNDGDVETPILVTFNGPVTAPITIRNLTTDQYIEVNRDLAVGEKLVINTAFGQKRVTKILADGSWQNATHYMKMPGSEFFNLVEGNNLIEYSTGLDYESSGVSIQWRNRFLAV